MSDSNTVPPSIRQLLAARCWTYVDLGKAAGLNRGTVANICCGSEPSPMGRRRIEVALDSPIWTELGWFRMLNRITAIIGVDPVLTDTDALRRVARRFGVRVTARMRRPAIHSALALHFSKEPAKAKPATAHA